jgi:hypothetical protein
MMSLGGSSRVERSIVSVKAVVMIYDDVTRQWRPSVTSSRGVSKVQIYRHEVEQTYRIVGRNVNDKQVTLNVYIFSTTRYNQATPTFHQWKDSQSNTIYGLNFVNAKSAEDFAAAMLDVLHTLNDTEPAGCSIIPSLRSSSPHPSSKPLHVTNNESSSTTPSWTNQPPTSAGSSSNGDQQLATSPANDVIRTTRSTSTPLSVTVTSAIPDNNNNNNNSGIYPTQRSVSSGSAVVTLPQQMQQQNEVEEDNDHRTPSLTETTYNHNQLEQQDNSTADQISTTEGHVIGGSSDVIQQPSTTVKVVTDTDIDISNSSRVSASEDDRTAAAAGGDVNRPSVTSHGSDDTHEKKDGDYLKSTHQHQQGREDDRCDTEKQLQNQTRTTTTTTQLSETPTRRPVVIPTAAKPQVSSLMLSATSAAAAGTGGGGVVRARLINQVDLDVMKRDLVAVMKVELQQMTDDIMKAVQKTISAAHLDCH